MGRIVFYIEPAQIVIEAKDDETVQEALLRHKVDIGSSCGGVGTCTTCLVKVVSDLNLLPERNELEIERANERGLVPNERLSCQIFPHSNLKIEIDGPREIYDLGQKRGQKPSR